MERQDKTKLPGTMTKRDRVAASVGTFDDLYYFCLVHRHGHSVCHGLSLSVHPSEVVVDPP